jgi:hypothetical protein
MVDSNGDVWVSNVGGHEVIELSPSGAVVHVFAERQDPGGMVQLPRRRWRWPISGATRSSFST